MNVSDKQKPLVLITGSSGLIGSRVAKALAEEYRVAGLDLDRPDDNQENLAWFRCDLTDATSVEASLEQVRARLGGQIASVIHLAAYYDFSGEPSPLYQELTVDGTRRLLRHLQSFDVEQFVFSSTLLVMQSSEDGQAVDASSPVEAEWDYSRSKLAAEEVICAERGAIPAVVLRMAGAYDEDCHSPPISQQIIRIYEKQLESYFFPGDKSHGQAFIHLDDLVACIGRVVACRNQLDVHEVFVVGEEDVMSYQELQEELGTMIHGQEWPTIRIPKVAAKAGAWVKDKLAGGKNSPFIKPWMIDLADQNYPVNLQRARARLGWEPEHALRDTLAEMVGRLHHDPVRWYEINGIPVPGDVEANQADGARQS